MGSICDPFDQPLLGYGPVHRKRLRAGQNDRSDKLMGLACGEEANRIVEYLKVAVFINAPNHPDMSTTECYRVGYTERHRFTLISIPFSISIDWAAI